MEEKLLTLIQQNQEKLDLLLAAPAIPWVSLLALLGSVITATVLAGAAVWVSISNNRKAADRQREDIRNDRDLRRREEHRKQLEEAIRQLIGLKQWATETVFTIAEFIVLDKHELVTMEQFRKSHPEIKTSGDSKYQTVLALLKIYSASENIDSRLGDAYRSFMQTVRKDRASREATSGPAAEGLITVCDIFEDEVRTEIREKYLP